MVSLESLRDLRSEYFVVDGAPEAPSFLDIEERGSAPGALPLELLGFRLLAFVADVVLEGDAAGQDRQMRRREKVRAPLAEVRSHLRGI